MSLVGRTAGGEARHVVVDGDGRLIATLRPAVETGLDPVALAANMNPIELSAGKIYGLQVGCGGNPEAYVYLRIEADDDQAATTPATASLGYMISGQPMRYIAVGDDGAYLYPLITGPGGIEIQLQEGNYLHLVEIGGTA